jgi:phage gp16-like protein
MMDEADHPYGHKSVTLLAIGLLIFTLFQLTQVVLDRVALSKVKLQADVNMAQADKAVDEGKKMLDQLNVIAIATQKLADGGNANAKDIVAQLNRAGIKINPNFKKGESTDPKVTAPASAATPPAAAPTPAEK